MAWFRKKNDPVEQDEIIILDTIVWKGIDQKTRLDKLAEAADRAAEHHRTNPEATPLYEPSSPLPVDLFETKHQAGGDAVPPLNEDQVRDREQQAYADNAGDDQEGEYQPDPAPENPIPDNMVPESLINDAMNAVMQSDTFAATMREKTDPPAEPTANPPANRMADPAALNDGMDEGYPFEDPHDETDTGFKLFKREMKSGSENKAEPETGTGRDNRKEPGFETGHDDAGEPDNSVDIVSTVQSVVREEIGSWMQQNMDKIIAESFSKAAIEQSVTETRRGAKPARKTRQKGSKPAKPRAQRNVKSKPGIQPLSSRDQ